MYSQDSSVLLPPKQSLNNNPNSSHILAYRPDIDGLRALAVLLVILYHAFPKWAHGGFIGVDIFFVISGFLITSIILKDLKANTFSFIWFYSKRILRIFPALLLVLASSILLGWIFLYPAEYQLLGKHLISAAGFFSNFTYLGEAGYFDSRAVEKPLLHLWSLAIEEQFYVIWPLILFLGYRLKIRFGYVILALWILSFATNIYYAYHDSVLDFYTPQARFWELLTGALLANWAVQQERFSRIYLPAWVMAASTQAVSILGFAMLAVGVTITYSHHRFPGWLALLPAVGAMLLIAAGPKAWINRFFLASRVMVAIGLISYPLYLWHWILLSFAQIWGPIFLLQRLLLIVLSLVLSYLTYKLLEKPLRNNVGVVKKALLLIFGMLIILGLALQLKQNGFEQRPITQLNQYDASAYDGGDGGNSLNTCGLSDLSLSTFFQSCHEDKREKAKFAVIGDSHSISLWSGLVRSSQENYRWLTISGPGGPQNLRPYLSNARANVSAKDSVYTDKAVEQISQNSNIKVVLLAFSSNALLPSMADASERDQVEAYKGFDSIITKFIQSNQKVVLLVDNPHLTQPQECFHRKVGIAPLDRFDVIAPGCEIPLEQFMAFTAKYRKILKDLALAHPNSVYVFDSTPYLCSTETGMCSYQKDGKRMYSYTDHLSDYAAGRVGEPLNRYLVEVVNKK